MASQTYKRGTYLLFQIALAIGTVLLTMITSSALGQLTELATEQNFGPQVAILVLGVYCYLYSPSAVQLRL